MVRSQVENPFHDGLGPAGRVQVVLVQDKLLVIVAGSAGVDAIAPPVFVEVVTSRANLKIVKV